MCYDIILMYRSHQYYKIQVEIIDTITTTYQIQDIFHNIKRMFNNF